MDIARRDELFPSAKVFCNPHFLHVLQNSPHRPFPDSKTLVDLELARDPDQILQTFSHLPQNLSEQQYHDFLNWAFEPRDPEKLIEKATPLDYNTQIPSHMLSLATSHPHILSFVLDLKKRWHQLCRQFPYQDADKQLRRLGSPRSSLIPLPHQFFVPGGRFREFYYWDTLWIVKGLIASDMLVSAKNSVRNLLYLVDRIGFVPNGTRVYYLNRSHPPTLTEAVSTVFDALPSAQERLQWLEECVPTLDKEYENFAESHSVAKKHPHSSMSHETLSLYTVDTYHARPESFREDTDTVMNRLETVTDEAQKENVKRMLLQDLAAGAESGWDYTSRFMTKGGTDVKDLITQQIIPCCLNGIILKAEKDLSSFHDFLAVHSAMSMQGVMSDSEVETLIQKHTSMSERYRGLAKTRQNSMMKFMWNESNSFWFDCEAATGKQTEIISCAGIIPAWAGCWEDSWSSADAEAFVNFVTKSSGLLGKGGLSCSTTRGNQQWDFPNCWPPLVDFAVGAMQRVAAKFPDSGAAGAAEEFAKRFIRTSYSGWISGKEMHEKYDSRYDSGERGTGGEYEPQTGFGWTNGTILWLLRDYADVIAEDNSESWL